MCIRAGLLIGWDFGSKRALVTRGNCDSWKCVECAKRMAERWILRAGIGARALLNAGDKLSFVTITSHEKLKTFAATEVVWRDAWGKLYNALKRVKPDLCYMIVPERHEDGRMHVHALWNAGVTERWLKDNARKRGLGYMADVSPIHHSGSAEKYVTKYVGKSLGDDVPERFRRVRVSQNWAEIPEPDSPTKNLTWEYVASNGALQTVYEQCEERGISLIDIKTGEYFDDVDLGTMLWST
jgi:hypothetical protein